MKSAISHQKYYILKIWNCYQCDNLKFEGLLVEWCDNSSDHKATKPLKMGCNWVNVFK